MSKPARRAADRLKHHDIVVIAETCPEPEDRGMRGYVIGQVEDEMCAVFFPPPGDDPSEEGHVICFHPRDVIGTGLIATLEPPGPSLRVSAKGEIL